MIAVDPSSPITGGALLGDRVRMQAYAGDDGVFIRSMASRGHAGGLAATSTVAATVLDAAGFDIVLLETVGTGQSEVEVAAAADTTVVLEAPEMGDEVQAIKAGLLEVADIVVVNKGDRPGAQRTAAQLRAMLVPTVGPQGRRPVPAGAEAARGPGDDRARRATACRRCWPRSSGTVPPAARRVAPAPSRARGGAGPGGPRASGCADRLDGADRATATDAAITAVADHELDPYAAADRLLDGRPRDGAVTPLATRRRACVTRPFAAPAGDARSRSSRPAASSCPSSPPFAVEVARRPTRSASGVAVGAFALASLAMRPVVGWASDRFGRRPLLVGGALLTVVALAPAPRRDRRCRCSSPCGPLLGVAEAFFFVAVLAAASDSRRRTAAGRR